MQKTKYIKEHEKKTNCLFCGKMIVRKNMDFHIDNFHRFEPNFELKSNMLDVISAIDNMRLDFLAIKEASNSIYSKIDEDLIQDNLYKKFEENMMKFKQLNLAKEMGLIEYKNSCQ